MIQARKFGPAAKVPAGAMLLATLVTMGAIPALRPGPLPHWMQDLCGTEGATMLSAAHDGSGAAARPATIVKPLACTPLPNVPGKSMTTALVEFPPGAYTGPHRHPGSVTAYVVSGTIRSQMAGGAAADYGPGQVWFEPPKALHLFAENASDRHPATLLAVFVADSDCGALVIPEPEGK